MTPNFIKSHEAAADIERYRFVAFSGTGKLVTTAAAATDPIIGSSDTFGAEAGQMADIIQGGWGSIEAGGTFAAGDPLTADADGKAVKAEPVAGSIVRIGGFAQDAAVDGDIVDYLVAPGIINTPA